MRRADAATGNDKVILGAHAPDAFDDLVLVVSDYFNAFERDAEREAPAGEVGGVCVNCLFSLFAMSGGFRQML